MKKRKPAPKLRKVVAKKKPAKSVAKGVPGFSEKKIREVLAELSSRCLPPQMPGRIQMPDGFIAEISTTQALMRIDIGDKKSEGKRRVYWVNRDELRVHVGDQTVAFSHRLAARVVYVLKQLSLWNPIVPSDHGLVDPNNIGVAGCTYLEKPSETKAPIFGTEPDRGGVASQCGDAIVIEDGERAEHFDIE